MRAELLARVGDHGGAEKLVSLRDADAKKPPQGKQRLKDVLALPGLVRDQITLRKQVVF